MAVLRGLRALLAVLACGVVSWVVLDATASLPTLYSTAARGSTALTTTTTTTTSSLWQDSAAAASASIRVAAKQPKETEGRTNPNRDGVPGFAVVTIAVTGYSAEGLITTLRDKDRGNFHGAVFLIADAPALHCERYRERMASLGVTLVPADARLHGGGAGSASSRIGSGVSLPQRLAAKSLKTWLPELVLPHWVQLQMQRPGQNELARGRQKNSSSTNSNRIESANGAEDWRKLNLLYLDSDIEVNRDVRGLVASLASNPWYNFKRCDMYAARERWWIGGPSMGFFYTQARYRAARQGEEEVVDGESPAARLMTRWREQIHKGEFSLDKEAVEQVAWLFSGVRAAKASAETRWENATDRRTGSSYHVGATAAPAAAQREFYVCVMPHADVAYVPDLWTTVVGPHTATFTHWTKTSAKRAGLSTGRGEGESQESSATSPFAPTTRKQGRWWPWPWRFRVDPPLPPARMRRTIDFGECVAGTVVGD